MTTAMVSCAGLPKNVVIDSDPSKALVEVYEPKLKKYIELGKTPIKVTVQSIQKKLGAKYEYIALRVSRRGHVKEHLIYDTNMREQMSYLATLTPVEVWNDKTNEMSSYMANKLTINIQRVNKEIIKKNFKNALILIIKLINEYPNAHVYYDIKGSILYLMGKRAESLTSYQKSLSINPDNYEAKNMVKKISREVNI